MVPRSNKKASKPRQRKARRASTSTAGRKPTQKEERLVEGVLQGKSGARAARDAGYSARSAKQIAYETLTKPDLQAYINARRAEAKVSTDEVVGTLVSQMRANPLDMLDDQGRFSVQVARDRGLGHLIKSVTQRTIRGGGDEEVETVKVELHSAQQAAVQLSRIKGIEQAPRENKADREVIAAVNQAVEQLMELHTISRAKACAVLLQHRPDYAPWLNVEAADAVM
jgi:phage terminase small subunit